MPLNKDRNKEERKNNTSLRFLSESRLNVE